MQYHQKPSEPSILQEADPIDKMRGVFNSSNRALRPDDLALFPPIFQVAVAKLCWWSEVWTAILKPCHGSKGENVSTLARYRGEHCDRSVRMLRKFDFAGVKIEPFCILW
jgi:hypothetical protein